MSPQRSQISLAPAAALESSVRRSVSPSATVRRYSRTSPLPSVVDTSVPIGSVGTSTRSVAAEAVRLLASPGGTFRPVSV